MKKNLLYTALGLIGIMGTLSMGEVMANAFIVPDTENGTITVYSQDYSYWITIQDKNLGASVAGTGESSYGYYYQWGNNHGNYAGTNIGTLNELLDADVSERVNKGYSGDNDKFIIFDNGNKNTYDYRSGVYYTDETDNSYVGDSAYNNLRGGGNDNEEQENIVKGYDTVNHVVTNPENRQGPCPEGYHVPSAGEWHELMMLRCNANSDICSGSVINTNSLFRRGIGTAFMNDLLLPFAGTHLYGDGAVFEQGKDAYFWSSSPRGGSNPKDAWYLRFDSNYVLPSSSNNRARGNSLRCFKNSYVELPKTLNLFFMSDGEEVGTGEVTENMTGAVPEKAKNVTKTGYILEYRYLSGADATTGFDFETTPISGAWADESGNVYFIAKWTPVEYTLTLDLGDGRTQTITGYYGDTITQPQDPSRDGYRFIGWSPNIPSTMPAEDQTITAQWEPIEYTLTLDLGDGRTQTITGYYGDAITQPQDPSRDGYRFTGWSSDIPSTMPAENQTITAQWEAIEYTLTLDLGDGRTQTITGYYGDAITQPQDPSRDGYRFIGWSPNIPSTMPAEDQTITAQWEPIEYTLTLDLGDGRTQTITGYYGDSITQPQDPSRDGYSFAGWSPNIPSTMPAENQTITAQWEAISTGGGGTSGGENGGGRSGRGGLKKDSCPNGDYSDSYYDGTCGQKPTQKDENKDNDSNENIDDSESDPNYSQEMKDAYKFAHFYGITTMSTIKEADMDGYIIRSHLAKMMSQFAINVVGAKPNIGKEGCDKFNDIANETDELKGYMKTACELGLMGLHADGKTVKDNFDPNDHVTRAEFGTVLSRFLYLDENNLTTQEIQEGAEWYSKHLSALKLNGIMTQIDGQRITSKELRGYVMLMLMRSAQI